VHSDDVPIQKAQDLSVNICNFLLQTDPELGV